ncbi:Uncharacterized protein dnm_053310 [Desulfonema magnum]|uniref:Uncharacterized protein n=1 Tax=Desulfonema magnum TaxID=45655 RepID=A0A975BPG1_9BACT|nr:Uncharacterized protein dnm_053310 [Desulfonema magnum]
MQTRPGCFPNHRKGTFRTGLQTPSGNLSLMRMGCKPRPAKDFTDFTD